MLSGCSARPSPRASEFGSGMCTPGSDPVDASSRYGWQTLTATAQYIAVLDGPHEFLFSVGVDRQFSGTGAGRVQPRGFSGVGATTPSIYFGKGLGDLDIGQSWSMSEDGLSWVFVLRDGLKFHDGEPITAEDVKFSFERYRGANQGLIKQ
jgi:ABC-type transport system substrate-binding protein